MPVAYTPKAQRRGRFGWRLKPSARARTERRPSAASVMAAGTRVVCECCPRRARTRPRTTVAACELSTSGPRTISPGFESRARGDRLVEQPRVELAARDRAAGKTIAVPPFHPFSRPGQHHPGERRRGLERTAPQVDRLQERDDAGVERVAAQLVARKRLAIDDEHARAGAGEQRRGDRSRRSRARNEDVEHVDRPRPTRRFERATGSGPADARRGQTPLNHALPRTSALFFEPKPRQLQSAALDRPRARRVRDEVEIALGIRIGEVDRRRQHAATRARAPRSRRRRRRSRPADGRSSTWSTIRRAGRRDAPNTRRTQRASTASFSTVDVPW